MPNTATYCKSLQITANHCKTLQKAAKDCKKLQRVYKHTHTAWNSAAILSGASNV